MGDYDSDDSFENERPDRPAYGGYGGGYGGGYDNDRYDAAGKPLGEVAPASTFLDEDELMDAPGNGQLPAHIDSRGHNGDSGGRDSLDFSGEGGMNMDDYHGSGARLGTPAWQK